MLSYASVVLSTGISFICIDLVARLCVYIFSPFIFLYISIEFMVRKWLQPKLNKCVCVVIAEGRGKTQDHLIHL